MPPQKSIFRQPGAKHFQLVHRSQRDPLIHDPDANQHVLKPFERENIKKGKGRVELESTLSPEELEHDIRAHVGEAALYGIYYDDTQYDYMQHLRSIGVQEDDVDSILIEAPILNNKSKRSAGLDLPPTVFASTTELPSNYESQQAVPESIAGFKPDMDPHLRQVLDALDDDAFVDDEIDDDFFAEIVKDGERGHDEDPRFNFKEEGWGEGDGGQDPQLEVQPSDDAPWEERFAFFKKSQLEEMVGGSDDEFASEAGDTVHELPALQVIGGKRRRKGTSQASGYSMSSSSMYRNDALQTLDERFDQLMLREYDEEKAESEEDAESDGAPELITTREDFEAMMDEFMTEYEVLGRKLLPKLPGETGVEKLETLRRTMGQDGRMIRVYEDSENEEDMDILAPLRIEDKKDRWDCETILSTYSNLENHPRLIRARDSRPVPKIRLHPKTGLPTIEASKPRDYPTLYETSEEFGSENTKTTRTRPPNESKEDKRLRKAVVKADKQTRRAAKKMLKEQFGVEMQAQKKREEARTKGRTRKL